MQDLLIFLFVISPIISNIFQRKWTRQEKILSSVGLLTIIACLTVGYTYFTSPLNLYGVLGVSSSIPNGELRKHYLNLIKKYHPDNNSNPDAENIFIALRESYEILNNPGIRDNYDRFGPIAIKAAVKNDESTIFITTGIASVMFYTLWGFLILVMMSGKNTQQGRTWALTALAALVLIEIQLRFASSFPLFSSLLPTSTNHDKVELLRALFPSVFSGCRIMSMALFEDVEEFDRLIMLQTYENTKGALAILYSIHEQLNPKNTVEVDGVTERVPANPEVIARLQRAKELIGEANQNAPFRADAVRKPIKKDEKNPLWNLVSYIAIPIALNFLLNR